MFDKLFSAKIKLEDGYRIPIISGEDGLHVDFSKPITNKNIAAELEKQIGNPDCNPVVRVRLVEDLFMVRSIVNNPIAVKTIDPLRLGAVADRLTNILVGDLTTINFLPEDTHKESLKDDWSLLHGNLMAALNNKPTITRPLSAQVKK